MCAYERFRASISTLPTCSETSPNTAVKFGTATETLFTFDRGASSAFKDFIHRLDMIHRHISNSDSRFPHSFLLFVEIQKIREFPPFEFERAGGLLVLRAGIPVVRRAYKVNSRLFPYGAFEPHMQKFPSQNSRSQTAQQQQPEQPDSFRSQHSTPLTAQPYIFTRHEDEQLHPRHDKLCATHDTAVCKNGPRRVCLVHT